MRVLGTPERNNQTQINRIKTILDFRGELQLIDEEYISQILTSNMRVLDIGQSLRDLSQLVSSRVKSLETLDINVSYGYPDIQMDLCEKVKIPTDLRFDVIFAFSLLEHCYNPFVASENLFGMLKPDSRIVGSAPFLFPHHCPEDLSYQDYFRFTKDSFSSLFPDAKRIIIFPQRGRVGSGLNILSQRYKYVFERKIPSVARMVNRIGLKQRPEQSSGFHFEVFN